MYAKSAETVTMSPLTVAVGVCVWTITSTLIMGLMAIMFTFDLWAG